MWKNLKNIDNNLYEETFELDRSLITKNSAIYIQIQFIAERLVKFLALKELISNSFEDEDSKETLGSLLNNKVLYELLENMEVDVKTLKEIQKLSNKLKHTENVVLFEIETVLLFIESIYNLSINIGKRYSPGFEEEYNSIYFQDMAETELSKFISQYDDDSAELEKIRLKRELDSIDIKSLNNENIKSKYLETLSKYKALTFETSKDKYILNLVKDSKNNQDKLKKELKKFKQTRLLSISFLMLIIIIAVYFAMGLIYRSNDPYMNLISKLEEYDNGDFCYIDECYWYYSYYNDINLEDFDQDVYIWLNKNTQIINLKYFPFISLYGEDYFINNTFFLKEGIIDSTYYFDSEIVLDTVYFKNSDELICYDYNENDEIICEDQWQNISFVKLYFNDNIEDIYYNLEIPYNTANFYDIFSKYFSDGKKIGYY